MKRVVGKFKLAVAGVLFAGALAFFCVELASRRPSDGEAGRSDVEKTVAPAKSRAIAAVKPQLGRAVKPERALPKAKPEVAEEDEADEMTPAERALSDRIEKALDEEDFKLASACAGEVLRCANKEVRASMVETLGWFGAKALPELTPFLADADEDVRESAMREWTMALSDIDDEAEKIGTVELAFAVVKDEDMLEDLSNEYIGVDDALAVNSLLRVIEGGGTEPGVAKAKETYEFVTGEDYAGREAAEKWLAEQKSEE